MSLPSKSNPIWGNAEFKKFPLKFRIEAILSDGQWYTDDKVRMLCGEPDGTEVKPIFRALVEEGVITGHPNGDSYCMSYAQMKKWRADNGVPLEAQVISKIVAPRIFGSGAHRMTENEFFDMAPLHQLGTVTFHVSDVSMLDQIRRDLGWMGKFKLEKDNRCKLLCLSAPIARQRLLEYDAAHEGRVLVKGCNSHNVSMQRELCELDQSALADIVEYYVAFAPVLVPYITKTFRTYMSNASASELKSESDSILCEWIINFIQKYKESDSRPFSVMVKTVLPKRVYEFSNNQIGRDVNKFQVNKAKAIKSLNDENGTEPDTYYSNETIRHRMMDAGYKLSKSEYADYDAALDSWRKSNWATTLDWDDGEQKSVSKDKKQYDTCKIVDPFSSDAITAMERRSGLQRAVVRAGVESGEYADALTVLRMMTDSRTLNDVLSMGESFNMSDGFKRSLASCITSYII